MTTESRLQEKIMDFCKKRGLLCRPVAWRGRQGCPDLVIVNSPPLWVELKHPSRTGRLRPAQQRELARMEAAGAEVLVSHSFDEIVTTLDARYADL